MEQLDNSSDKKWKNRPDPETVYDLIIVGGGPGATTALVYAARKLLNVAILTYDFQGQVGYTSTIENYMGFQTISGAELVQKFYEQVEQFNIPIGQGEKVTRVDKADDLFKLTVESGAVFQSRTVIIATGKRDRKLGVPGEDEFIGRGVAYCSTCDAPFYRDLKVVVTGGGNSAFTAALDLLKVAKEVTLVNHAAGWQADEILQKSVRKYDHIRFLDHHEIVSIEGDNLVRKATVRDRESKKETTIEADGVFIEIGLIPNSEPVVDLVRLNEVGEIIVDCACQTNIEGLYGAGDVTTVPHKQIIISAGEGAKAALTAYEYLTQRGLV